MNKIIVAIGVIALIGGMYLYSVSKNGTQGGGVTVSDDIEEAAHESGGDSHTHFANFPDVETWEDDGYLRIASNGLPSHQMMKGITSWQQQVPIPQDYTGDNSWSVPLEPVFADEPMLLSDHFHRGAVAIAVNGVPMFNAVNNRGEYAVEIGELDQYGGHSGRADDYHYHMVPEHLEEITGEGSPVAYAFDGYPIYTQTDQELDEYLGRLNTDGSYQYHAVDYAPYFIAGFRGEVTVDSPANAPEDQVEPQARSFPVRTADYGPLRGAEITDFERFAENEYLLTYTVDGQEATVAYSWDDKGMYTFVYTNPSGDKVTQTHASQY